MVRMNPRGDKRKMKAMAETSTLGYAVCFSTLSFQKEYLENMLLDNLAKSPCNIDTTFVE